MSQPVRRLRTLHAAGLGICAIALASAARGGAQPSPSAPAALEISQLSFHSAVLMNVHHTLFAAAWARRPEAGTAKALAGALPAPLDVPSAAAEQSAWDAAIDYYDRELASRDLLFDRTMYRIKMALVAERLSDEGVDEKLRSVLDAAVPVYRSRYWPAHDGANRAWIQQTGEKLRVVAPEVIPRLERLYGEQWFTSPVRIDVVWVGNRQGAYTTNGPTHVTISSGDPENTGWTSVETVFHEVSHTLVLPLQRELADALGARVREHGVLWHVIQFYLTGAAVQETLRARGVEYTPYMYSTGLLDRAWGRYRKPVEESWGPYVRGGVTRAEAIARTVAAVTPR
jgi:hypothetical protein